MGRMRPTSVRIKSYRDLCQPEIIKTRFDRHLGGELHPGASRLDPLVEVLSEPTHTAMNIVKRRPKPKLCQPRKHWIAPPSMQKRHRVRHHSAATGRKPASHDQVISFAKLIDE